MKQSLTKLVKFFKLEADNGFDNRAVIGGLERILESWEAEARLEGVPEDLIQVVALRLRDYARLSPTSRAETLEGLWHRLERESDAPLPPLHPAAKTPWARPETNPARALSG